MVNWRSIVWGGVACLTQPRGLCRPPTNSPSHSLKGTRVSSTSPSAWFLRIRARISLFFVRLFHHGGADGPGRPRFGTAEGPAICSSNGPSSSILITGTLIFFGDLVTHPHLHQEPSDLHQFWPVFALSKTRL